MTEAAMTTTASPPTRDDVLEKARAILPLLEANRGQVEQDRSVPAANVEALSEAGLLRLFQPRLLGGPEVGMGTMLAVAPLIAAACPSTAWVLMVFAGHDWVAGMFPRAVQDEIWKDGAEGRIAGGLANSASATPVGGGWRVSGRWPFGSGIDHARWFVGGCRLTTAAADQPKGVHLIMPAADVTVEDTWFTLGLRGSGSKDVIAEDVFVPAHRSMATGKMFGGLGAEAKQQTTNLYRLPVTTGLALLAGSVLGGITQRLYDELVAEKRTQRNAYTGQPKAQSSGLQHRIAEAAGEIRSAQLLLAEVTGQMEAMVASGQDPDLSFRVETKWKTVYAAELLRRAAERLYRAAGARDTYDRSLIQQLYRDITMASHHATIDVDGAAEIFGRVELGLDPGSVLI